MFSMEAHNKTLISKFMHELKTPLAIVRSHLENEINNNSLSPKLQKKLAFDIEELARINNLINEMNFLLNPERSCKREQFHSESLLAILVDLIEFINPIAEEKKQKISLIANENIEYFIHKEKFQQLLLNLLTNAIKYTPNFGTIVIKLSHNETEIQISIKDSGIGMSEEQQKHIFEPFYRINTEHTQGLGLGLSIVQAIVEQHQIKLKVKSQLDQGTTSTLYLQKEKKDVCKTLDC